MAGENGASYAGGPAPADGANHGVKVRLRDDATTAERLTFMGCEEVDRQRALTRLAIKGSGADIIDLEAAPDDDPACEGVGSVHHAALAVESRVAQEVHKILPDTGAHVAPVKDRDCFREICFRPAAGVTACSVSSVPRT